MLVSIVIPAYNASSTLEACLAACQRQTCRTIEIVVADDGSTDRTPEIARTAAASDVPLHCVRQDNQGPAAARNLGASAARGEFLAFTDADCVPHPDWIERLLEGFEEGVVAVGGSYGIANPDHVLARLVHDEIIARHARFGSEVDFLGSFNAMYRRDAFEAAGGFDDAFRAASAEDNDLAYRLQDAGGKLRFVPEALVDHYHPERLLPYLRTQMGHGYWRMKLYAKHVHRARRGDRYAGPSDLLAPVLAAATVLIGVSVVAAACVDRVAYRAALGVWLVIALAYAATRVALVSRVVDRGALGRMALFMGVAVLRDVARMLGMAAGLVRFFGLIRRNGSCHASW